MDDRIVEFIAALRAKGVRVSVAESADALRAMDAAGIGDKDSFRLAIRATLVKEHRDEPTFDELFPFYFGSDAPPPLQQPGGGGSEQDREQLRQALEQMLQNMTPEQLRRLFESMMTGQPIEGREMRDMLNQAMGDAQMNNPYYQSWMSRRAMRAMQFEQLEALLQELLEQLREAGMSEQALEEIEREARENMQALGEQLSKEVGAGMARRAAEEQPPPPKIDDLMDRPFQYLGHQDINELRGVINRLASQLRSRAALRQKRGNRGTLDAKSTIRANLRFGGVPVDVRHRKKHLKPKLTIVCDLSTSMRPVVSFMLLLVYAMQDQISRTRSYAFIDDLTDISVDFTEARPEVAIQHVLERIRPGYYNTDLGNSLATFVRDQMGTVDRRTTVIILGDGRNNHNNPNLQDFEAIKRRARRVVWFNPEPRVQWGTGDSDMLEYEPLCDVVHKVSNLRELVDAVDSLFVYR